MSFVKQFVSHYSAFDMSLIYTSINLDKTLDELLSSIIKFDLSNKD